MYIRTLVEQANQETSYLAGKAFLNHFLVLQGIPSMRRSVLLGEREVRRAKGLRGRRRRGRLRGLQGGQQEVRNNQKLKNLKHHKNVLKTCLSDFFKHHRTVIK